MLTTAIVVVGLCLVPPPQPDADAFPGERVVTSETPQATWPPEEPGKPDTEDGIELVVHPPSWTLQRMRLSEMPENVRTGADRVGTNSICRLNYEWWWWDETVWNYEKEPGLFEAYVVVTHLHAEVRLHTDYYVLPETKEPQIALERGYHDIALAYYDIFDDAIGRVLREKVVGRRIVGYGATEEEAVDDATKRLNAIADAELELIITDRRLETNRRYFELTDELTNTDVDVAEMVAAALAATIGSDEHARYVEYGDDPLLHPTGMPDEVAPPATQPSDDE
ncbi:MAG: hypothetical protein AAGD32_10940 [Planctomycetota bacterium]